jgi:protein involved in polysaccharide export with SLBB domain
MRVASLIQTQASPRWRRGLGAGVLSLSTVVATAATPLDPPPAPPLLTPASHTNSYHIGRGDELNIAFVYTPELNTRATVRSDGRIGLPLVGDMQVEGLTTEQLRLQIEQALQGRVKRPQMSINVQGSAASQRVFVGGEVALPGAQPLVGPLTVLQAVMSAHGLKETAQASEVLVLRSTGSSTPPTLIKVDLAGLMAGKGGSQDLALQAQDVVLVPRSGVAQLNVWVDQYLRRNLPVNFGVNYTINPDRNTP